MNHKSLNRIYKWFC